MNKNFIGILDSMLTSRESPFTTYSLDKPIWTLQNLPQGNPLYEFLFRKAHPDSWIDVSIKDIFALKGNYRDKNLFLTDSILKAQNPNLVFGELWNSLTNGHYISLRISTAENIKSSLREEVCPLAFRFYYPFHFLLRRVFPKLKGFRKVCRLLHLPVDISKSEIMGRLIYCGFDLVDILETKRETVLLAKRNGHNNPSLSKPIPSEGFLFRMQRIGRHGKLFRVYKFRSMHPYAEYVQAYLHNTEGLDEGGKFKNDFRVSTGGKLIRKYWIDELPMLYNVLKGDLKLIGVRPISEHYLTLYPIEARQLRIQHKPGLLPPFYADMPQTFDEIVQSEMNYLRAYEKAPLQTDLLYLRRILTNIILRRARSK